MHASPVNTSLHAGDSEAETSLPATNYGGANATAPPGGGLRTRREKSKEDNLGIIYIIIYKTDKKILICKPIHIYHRFIHRNCLFISESLQFYMFYHANVIVINEIDK